jgi:hypothetical protein
MRTRDVVVAAAAAALGIALLPSCTPGGRQEAQQVAEAMDRFRKADNAAKPATVGTLRAVKCSATDVCHARDACLASAEATSKSLVLKSEVEQTLSAVEKGTLSKDAPEARALAGKLDEAETLLKEGFAALPPCDDQMMTLKRNYGF